MNIHQIDDDKRKELWDMGQSIMKDIPRLANELRCGIGLIQNPGCVDERSMKQFDWTVLYLLTKCTEDITPRAKGSLAGLFNAMHNAAGDRFTQLIVDPLGDILEYEGKLEKLHAVRARIADELGMQM